MGQPEERRPIFITGSHRSGTTWTAEVLSQAKNVELVDEPSNPDYKPRRIRHVFPYQFQYITDDNQDLFANEFDRVFSLRYPIGQIREQRDPYHLDKYFRQLLSTAAARARRRNVVCKDPLGVFSAPWIHNRYKTQTIVCVRHPAAFVSSIRRLGWTFDFKNWQRQPLFMRDCAGPYVELIEEFASMSPTLIDQAILLWKVIYNKVHDYVGAHDDWLVIRHEDLSREPMRWFAKAYDCSGLDFDQGARDFIIKTSSSSNSDDVAAEEFKTIFRNSREAARTWLKRLTPEEIRRIREATEMESVWFYGPDDWKA